MHGDEAAAPAAWERLFAGADADRIARHAVLFWNEAVQALAPTLGREGALALFQRSVRSACPGRHGPDVAALSPDDPFEPMRDALAALPDAEAAIAATALACAFRRQLAHLIGDTLATRLLKPVWHADDDPARHVPAGPPTPSTASRRRRPDRTPP